MTKTMLVDATHPEETRVAIVDGNRLSDFDFERTSKKQLKGNIYLAKVIRIEPSLQAAFVEYGGNRHGFLPFSEIHPDYFRIPMADRPHDAPIEDDTTDEDDLDDAGSDEVASEDLAAYAEEQIPHDHSHDHEHAHGHALSESPIAEQPAPTLIDEPAASLEIDSTPGGDAPAIPALDNDGNTVTTPFAQDPSADLGLITDFGNAAVSTIVSAEAPIETVGGEVAEEETRERRQPRPRYKIQEVVKRRQVMLIQVVKEERGNKGAALTTFLSLAGRYCVLMPNTDHGGGVSRKITSHQDRRRMKEMLDQLEVPEGMAVILRTAGMEQEPAEIQRDLEYLLRLWNNIREETLQSTAPALIYEEANLIKRSLRDMYAPDLDSILVAGAKGYQLAVDFMRTIMPDSMEKVKLYEDPIPLFLRYSVEKQIDQLYTTVVQLRSGGYIVINPTEALVSIDVNSGRATRERHIESTALKTNLEAADEVGRQLRLRDLAGLIVIDFIDMEDGRNNAAVERRMKEAMRADRARLQIGRISPFGLMELSRQRLRPSLMEINFEKCPHCAGLGLIRSVDSAAISILRTLEEEGIKGGSGELVIHVPTQVALYILNQKRASVSAIEQRYGLQILLHSDDSLVAPDYKLERARSNGGGTRGPAVNTEQVMAQAPMSAPVEYNDAGGDEAPAEVIENPERQNNNGGNRGGRRRGRYGFRGERNNNGGERGDRNRNPDRQSYPQPHEPRAEVPDTNGNVVPQINDQPDNIGNTAPGYVPPEGGATDADGQQRRGRRRGRRGGRGRHGGGGAGGNGGPGGNRPPREGNREGGYQPREPRGEGNWNRNREPAAAVHVPTSVHELDTTPRPPAPVSTFSSAPQSYAPAEKPHAPPVPRSAPAVSSPYQVVNEASDKPKGGWWKRITGQ